MIEICSSVGLDVLLVDLGYSPRSAWGPPLTYIRYLVLPGGIPSPTTTSDSYLRIWKATSC